MSFSLKALNASQGWLKATCVPFAIFCQLRLLMFPPFEHLIGQNIGLVWSPQIKMNTSPHSISCHLWWVIQCPSHSHLFMSNPEGKNVEKTHLVLPMFHLSSAILLITFQIKLRFHHPSIVGICIMSTIWVSTFYDGPITVNIWRHIVCGAQHHHLRHSWNQFPCGLLTFPSSSV